MLKKEVDQHAESTAVKENPPLREDPSIQERINRCSAEINGVLAKYNCDISLSMVLEPPNNIRPFINIIPRS